MPRRYSPYRRGIIIYSINIVAAIDIGLLTAYATLIPIK